MAENFEHSPRPSKRRKTSASDRSILKSPQSPGRLSSVTSALSSIGSRLLGRASAQKDEQLHIDSAYGSKEDSLNEEDAVVVDDAPAVVDNTSPQNNDELQTKTTRRSSRRTEVEVVKADHEVSKPALNTPAKSQKPKKPRTQVDHTRTSVELPTKSSETRRSSRRNQEVADEIPARTQKQGSGRSPRSSNRPKTNSKSVDENHEAPDEAELEPEPSAEVTQDDAQPSPVPEARSSGRQKRKPQRYTTETDTEARSNALHKSPEPTKLGPITKTISAVASPQPKGILTPSKRRREGPRKSVVFDDGEKQVEEQLGFKDIDTSTKKKKAQASVTDSTRRDEVPETPPEPLVEDEDLFFNQQVPQDMLQSLNLPTYQPKTPHEDSTIITRTKTLVLSRLTSSAIHTEPLPHLENQYKTLHSLLGSTVKTGESNSLLLLGSRGSGKTSLINTALADLTTKHRDDFHTVKLNGFFQTDDRLALREIWRQLGRERESQGEIDSNEMEEIGGSYADTMASLLSLLSHPDDFETAEVMDLDAPSNEQQTKTSKSVVIVLEEFDLFTLHPRQTLLYNLFDIAQSKKAPIAVIGTSTRVDVIDLLEKRVKSRFSHRWLHVPTLNSVEKVCQVLKTILTVNSHDVSKLGPSEPVDLHETVVKSRQIKEWNRYIETMFLPSSQTQALIQQTFYTTKSLPDILAALYIPIATLDVHSDSTADPTKTATISRSKSKSNPKSKSPSNTAPDTNPNNNSTPNPNLTSSSSSSPLLLPSTTPPTPLSLLPSLPTLHLSLLIATARLETLFSLTTTNFNATMSHHADLMNRSRMKGGQNFGGFGGGSFGGGSGMRSWGRDVCRCAWEDLVGWGLLVPVGGRGGGAGTGAGAGGSGSGSGATGGAVEGDAMGGREELSVRMVRVDVSLEEVAWGVREKFGEVGATGVGRGSGSRSDGGNGIGKGVGEVLWRWCREE